MAVKFGENKDAEYVEYGHAGGRNFEFADLSVHYVSLLYE